MKADPALPCEDEAYGALLGREGSAWHAGAYTHTHTHAHMPARPGTLCTAVCSELLALSDDGCVSMCCSALPPPTPIPHSGLAV